MADSIANWRALVITEPGPGGARARGFGRSARGGAGRARRRGLAGHRPRPSPAGGAGGGRRRRHAGPDHRAPAAPVLGRRTDRLRTAPGPGQPGRRARRDRIHGRCSRHPFRPGHRGGRVVLVGLAGNDVTAAFPIVDAVNNDLLISASFAYTSAAFAEVAALLSSGQITPRPLITHRFPLEAYQEAYQVLRAGSGPRGKVMLDGSAP